MTTTVGPGGRGERGAGSIEYIGVLVIVVSIIAAVLMQATPIGNVVAAKLCEAFGAECGSVTSSTAESPIVEPTRACTVTSDGLSYGKTASVSIIDAEDGTQIVRETKSNGDVEITVIDSGRLGASLKAPGAEFEVGIGGAGSSAKLKADAGIGLDGSYGQTYTFQGDDAAAQADEFSEYLAWTKGAKEVGEGVGTAGGLGPLLGMGLEQVTGFFYGKFNDYTPPAPSTYLVEGGTVVYGNADAGGIMAGASVSGEATRAIGARLNTDGTTTIYVKGAMSLDGKAEVGPETVKLEGSELESSRLIGSDVSASGAAELVGEVTLDANGEITGLAINGAVSGEAGGNLVQVFGSDLIDVIPEIGGGFNARVQLDIDDSNRSSVLSAMAALGLAPARVPVDPVGGTMQAVDAMDYLKTQAQRTGGVTVEQFDVSSTDLLNVALGGKLPAVGGLSAGVQAGLTSQETKNAWWLGEHGWEKWRSCAG